ncbi:MAG: hypothetical protein ACI31M_01885 [Bacilli bacterium]
MSSIFSNVNSLDSIDFYTNMKLIESVEYFENFLKLYESFQIKGLNKDEILKLLLSRSELINNFNNVLAIIASLILSLYKEDVVDEDKDLLVPEEAIQQITSGFVKKNGKLYLDDVEFENAGVCINFIRNALAHGGYVVNGNNIIINYDGKSTIIFLSGLISLCFKIAEYKRCKLKEINDRLIVADYASYNENGNQYYIPIYYDTTVNIKIKGNRKLKPENINNIYTDLGLFQYYNTTDKNLLPLEESFKKWKTIIEEKNEKCTIDFTAKEIDYNIIQNIWKYMNTLPEKAHTRYMFSTFIQKIVNSDKTAYLGLTELIYFIGIINDYSKFKFVCDFKMFDNVLSLIRFYSLFNFGLDNLLADKNGTNLLEILDKKKFDFSKMDLSEFDDVNMEIDRSLIYPTDIEKKEYIDKYRNNLKIVTERYKNYLNKSKKIDKIVQDKMLNDIKMCENDLMNAIINKKMIKRFDSKKYIRNLCIINHIRNSIAHGNYKMIINDYLDDSVNYIEFTDIYNGKNTYKKTISLEKFKKLFEYRSDVKQILDNNIVYRNEVFIEKMYLQTFIIDEKRRTEWKEYIKKNSENLDKLRLLHFYLNEISSNNFVFKEFGKNNEEVVAMNFSQLLRPAYYNETEIEILGIKLSIDDYYDILKQVIYFNKADEFRSFLISVINIIDSDKCREIVNYFKNKNINSHEEIDKVLKKEGY